MAQKLIHRTDQTKISIQQDMLKQLSSFEESANMLYKLSEKVQHESEEFPSKGFEYIYISLTDKICRNCPAFRECFGPERENTLKEISDIFSQVERKNCVSIDMASKQFRKRCVYYQAFMEEMGWLYKLAYQNFYWENRLQSLRYSMHGQLAAQMRLISELKHNMTTGSRMGKRERLRLSLLLFPKKVMLLDGMEYQKENGWMECVLLVKAMPGAGKAATLDETVSAFYQKEMKLNQEDFWLRRGVNRLSFVEESSFHVVFGKASCRKLGEKVNGDAFSLLNYSRQRAAMILADGMGTGENALSESKHAIEALENMIQSGMNEEYAVEILHQALLFQEKSKFSTLDVAVVSLQTGMLKLIKAGGCSTFIRRKDHVERIKVSSLPPGSYGGQQFDLKYKKLYDGDMVIMVSDGVLAFEQAPEPSFSIENIMAKIQTNNAQMFAQSLMEAVPVDKKFDDDKTILVASIWEKGKKNVG